MVKKESFLTANIGFRFGSSNCVHEHLFIGLRACVNSLSLIQIEPLLSINDIIIEVVCTWSQNL
jgi:hypothetical protein